MVPCNFHIGMKYFVKDLFLTYNKNTSSEMILEYCGFFWPSTHSHKGSSLKQSYIIPKCYKKDADAMAYKNVHRFWTKKVNFKQKNCSFFTFILINFLVLYNVHKL